MVKLNGETYDGAGMTVAALLEKEDFPAGRIVVERNMEIVPKTAYGTTVLAPGDEVEVVSFVGGG